jgi:hypothetical protein
MSAIDTGAGKIVYWHRGLPPLDAEAVAEHVVEATSGRIPGTLVHQDELWTQCYEDLMPKTSTRLEQEIVRLGGTTPMCSMNPSTAGVTTRPARRGCTVDSRTRFIAGPRETFLKYKREGGLLL